MYGGDIVQAFMEAINEPPEQGTAEVLWDVYATLVTQLADDRTLFLTHVNADAFTRSPCEYDTGRSDQDV